MSQKVRLVVSFLLAIGFLVFSYWVTNLRFPVIGEEKVVLTKLEMLREYISPREFKRNDSVLFVNVTYDKELRPVTDESGFIPVGRTQITDRHKLLRLLQYLKEHDDYKYILLDVFFENDVQTEWDAELYATICSMQKIVIPYHGGKVIADQRLMSKAGLADYLVTPLETDFMKYPYFCDTARSMPVRMYEEMTGRKIKKYGIFYTDDGRLARSSVILTFDIWANEMYVNHDDKNIKVWYDLGMDLLDDSIPEYDAVGSNLLYKKPNLTRGKYIVIGSLKGDDNHTTFMGEMPGAVINFNAYISLLKGRHIVSKALTCVYFVVFFLMSYLTLSRRRLQDILKEMEKPAQKKLKRRCLRFLNTLCSWIGYSSLLTILCIITYYTLGEAYDIFITSTLFSLLNVFVTSYDKICKILIAVFFFLSTLWKRVIYIIK